MKTKSFFHNLWRALLFVLLYCITMAIYIGAGYLILDNVFHATALFQSESFAIMLTSSLSYTAIAWLLCLPYIVKIIAVEIKGGAVAQEGSGVWSKKERVFLCKIDTKQRKLRNRVRSLERAVRRCVEVENYTMTLFVVLAYVLPSSMAMLPLCFAYYYHPHRDALYNDALGLGFTIQLVGFVLGAFFALIIDPGVKGVCLKIAARRAKTLLAATEGKVFTEQRVVAAIESAKEYESRYRLLSKIKQWKRK